MLAKDPEKVKQAQARKTAREEKIKSDREQALAKAITAFTPEEMFDELSHLWDKKKLDELHELLGAHLTASMTRANQSGVATGATTTRPAYEQRRTV